MGRKLYLGTDSGIVVLERSNGSWSKTGSALEGKFVEKLELAPDGSLLASLPRDGVYKAENPLGPWRRTLEADVRGLAISPHNPANVFAGTEPASAFRSINGGDTWEELTAVKELPGAPQWTFPVPPHIAHVRTFDFIPGEPQTVFAGIEVGGLIRSGNGGDTWEEHGEGVYEDIHYILTNPTNPDVMYSTTGKGFYRSLDKARTWEFCNKGMANYYTHPVVVRPENPDVVYVGAAAGSPNTFGGPQGAAAQIYRSQDAGRSWETLNNGLPERFHGMVRGLIVDPSSQDILYAGTSDGELYQGDEEGDRWSLIMKDLPAVWVIRIPSS